MAGEKIFFSYSRTDSQFVLRLARDLRNSGENVWLDQLDIPAGTNWDNEVEKALNNAECLIAVLSKASVASNNVMDEVSYAIEKNKRVVPVLINDCEIPFRLRRLQHIDFQGDYSAAFGQLKNSLQGTPNEIKITQPQKSRKKPLLIATAAVALLLIILAASGVFSGSGGSGEETSSPENTSTDNTGPGFKVGDSYEGGTIVYVDSTGMHGMVITSLSGDIEVDWEQAVQLKDNLVKSDTSHVENSWRLPTIGELQAIYSQRNLNNMAADKNDYWSGTEVDATHAKAFDFKIGEPYDTDKLVKAMAMAIREF